MITPCDTCGSTDSVNVYGPYPDVENGPCAADCEPPVAICDPCEVAAHEEEERQWARLTEGDMERAGI